MLNQPTFVTDPNGDSPFVIGAIAGALSYTLQTAFSNGGFKNRNWGSFASSTVQGAVFGGLGAEVGDLASTIVNGTERFAFQTAAHGFLGGINSVVNGGSFGSGALAGGVGSMIGGATSKWGPEAQIGLAAFSGGVSSGLSGGSFWQGAAIGGLTAAVNHVGHSLETTESGYGKLYSDEDEAYRFMWRNAVNSNVEHTGFLLKDGVFISDISGNNSNNGGDDIARYKVRNGNLRIRGKSYKILGHVHTHQALDGFGGTNLRYNLSDWDIDFASKLGKPVFAMARNNKVYGYDYHRYVGKTWSPYLNMNGYSTIGLLNGKNSLIKLLK